VGKLKQLAGMTGGKKGSQHVNVEKHESSDHREKKPNFEGEETKKSSSGWRKEGWTKATITQS